MRACVCAYVRVCVCVLFLAVSSLDGFFLAKTYALAGNSLVHRIGQTRQYEVGVHFCLKTKVNFNIRNCCFGLRGFSISLKCKLQVFFCGLIFKRLFEKVEIDSSDTEKQHLIFLLAYCIGTLWVL